MIKSKILFICVGQCGGNVGKLFAKKGYICHFINSSNDDLMAIDEVNEDCKYHIPSAMGCNKNRMKAKLYAKDYYNHIVETIEDKFPRQTIVFFVFSLGGGTGGGISPMIMEIISQRNPNKHYGAIVVLPSDDEPSIQCLSNGLESYKELSSRVGNLKSVFLLDNNRGDRFSINQEFVYRFDRFVNITIPDERGIIDGAELECLITQSGVTTLYDVRESEGRLIVEDNIFAPVRGQSSYMGVSIKDKVNLGLVQEKFGVPIDTFIGYNNDSNLLIVTGLQASNNRFVDMGERIKSKQRSRDVFANDNDVDVNIPIVNAIPNENKKVVKSIPKDIDYDDIFGKFF